MRSASILLAALTLGGPAWPQAMAPIPIALPKPLFEGTPRNLQVPNLEKPLGRPREPFLAPAGTANVALRKPVEYSGPQPTMGQLDMILDGEKAGADGTYVELGSGVQNVTIDLGSKHTIYAILVWHYHKQARVYNDVIVRVAGDPDFLEDVRALFNNDHDNSSGLGIGKDLNYVETAEGKLIDAKGVEARYVRLSSNGNHVNALNHYVEVEVFGKPLK
jgi:hypothetical protein